MRTALLAAALLLLVACGSQSSPPSQPPSFTLERIAQLTPEQVQNLSQPQLEQINRVLVSRGRKN